MRIFYNYYKKASKHFHCAFSIILLSLFAALTLYFCMNTQFYMSGDASKGTLIIAKKRILAEAAILAAAVFLFFFRRKIAHFTNIHGRKLTAVLMVLTPFFTFASMYIITHGTPKNFNPKNYNSLALTPLIFVCNIIIISMILLFFLVLTNSMRLASALCHLVCLIFCIADHYICVFRGNPILASDIASLGTALDVAGNYSFKLNFQIVLMLQYGLVFIYLFYCLGPSRLFAGRKRLIFSVLSTVVLLFFVRSFFMTDYLKKIGLNLNGFKPSVTYHRYGGILTFVYSFHAIRIDKPQDYSPGEIESLCAEYPSDSAKDTDAIPNIIVIIDEAFSDPGVIADLKASEDYLPFWHSIQNDYIHGYTYASVLGGSTANTEFEVLTGNSTVIIPKNCIAFQVYFKDKMPSLVSNCADMGYQELTAIHPFSAKNYNRPNVYSFLGFETYLHNKNFPKDVQRLRQYISDMAVIDMIIDRYEKAKTGSDDPFFIYSMTMQNHGSYGRKFDNLQNTITLPEYPDEKAEQYVNLIKHTDEAFEKLITYFSQVEEPTVILLLGDHQPALPEDFLKDITNGQYSKWSTEDMMKQFAIPFLLWSNYDLPVKEYEKTSMNYLQSILMDSCNLPMTGYQKYLLALSEKIPAITANGYWGADGIFYDPEDTTSPYYEDLAQYKRILYNNIIDYKNRPDSFYELAD